MKYKGQILSAIPCKGYAFIKPAWAKDTDGSEKNIYAYYASDREKTSRRCFINVLDKSHPELHTVKTNKRGEEIYLPVDEPQTVWFEVVLQDYKGSYKLMAINLVDEKHVTPEERAEAENNITEPDFTDEHSLLISEPVPDDSYIDALLSQPVNKLLPAIITDVSIPVITPSVIYLGTTLKVDEDTEVVSEVIEEYADYVEYSDTEIEDDDYEEDDYYGYDQFIDCQCFEKTRKQNKKSHPKSKKGNTEED